MKLALKSFSLLLLFLLPLYVRTIIEGRVQLRKADELFLKEQYSLAFSHYRSALHWWSPGNIYANRAEVQLETFLGDKTKEKKDRIEAARALYEGLMASRNFLHDDRLKREEVKDALYELSPESRPSYVRANRTEVLYHFQIVAQIGFWGWIFSIFSIIFYGFKPQGSPKWRPLLRGVFSGICFFLLWICALSVA